MKSSGSLSTCSRTPRPENHTWWVHQASDADSIGALCVPQFWKEMSELMSQSFHVSRRSNPFRLSSAVVFCAATFLWIGCSDQGDDPKDPLGSGGPGDGNEPQLTSVVPARTYVGDEIRLTGSEFGTDEGTVAFTTATYGINTPGTVYRMDDVPIPLRPAFESRYKSDYEILKAIEQRIRQRQLSAG